MGSPVIHFEIGCNDAAKTTEFYRGLLGWRSESFGPTMSMINTQSECGIHGHINQLGHPPHNYTLIYAQVDDLDTYLKRAEKLGGKTVVPPQEVPNMGHFAWISDPEGTLFGLWKPMQG